MRDGLNIFVNPDEVELSRSRSTGLDHIYIYPSEIDTLIVHLQGARAKMANSRRVTAQRLLTEAEQLDPTV